MVEITDTGEQLLGGFKPSGVVHDFQHHQGRLSLLHLQSGKKPDGLIETNLWRVNFSFTVNIKSVSA
jgi:hypothetical protein